MARIEEVIRMIYRLCRKRWNKTSSSCPNEETLACFSEGKLSDSESKAIQQHLISCPRCAEIVSLFCRRFTEEKDVPEFLIRRAKGLVSEKSFPNILDVVLVLKEKALQILGTTGDIILDNQIMPLPVLRSRQITDFPQEIRLIKEFNDIKLTLNIQKLDKDKIRVNLDLMHKISLMPLGGLCIVLLKDNQELESYEDVLGNATFDKVGFGRYIVQIMRKDKRIGSITLEIK